MSKININKTTKHNVLILLLVIVLTIVLTQAAEVTILSDTNFTNFINTHPYVIVQFYAPWCRHCNTMAPQYKKLALLSEGKEFIVAKLDAIANNQTAQANSIQGFPTIKLYVNGVSVNYDGGRTANDMIRWMENVIVSKITKITEEEANAKMGVEHFVLIKGVFSSENKAILELTKATDTNIKYYYTQSLQSFEQKITLYLQNLQSYKYDGEIEISAIKSWAFKFSLPTVVPLNDKHTIKYVFQTQLALPSFILVKNKDLSSQSFIHYESFCKANKQVICTYVIEQHKMYKVIIKWLKMSGKQSTLVYFKYKLKEGWQYPHDINTLTSQSIADFLFAVKAGSAVKYIGTHAQEQRTNLLRNIQYVNVIQLTDNTFDSTIQQNKYVLVEYYSPSCKHCIQFAVQYEKLALKLKEEHSEVVIAAVDVQHQQVVAKLSKVSAFPTLKLYADGNQLQYNGDRTVNKIIKFIKSVTEVTLLPTLLISEIKKPSIAIYGINENSFLKYLPILYTKYPIYHILEEKESQFKIQYHGKQIKTFNNGNANLNIMVDWITDITNDVLVNLTGQSASKRLSNALQQKMPILAIFVRNQTSAKPVIQLLQIYCKEKPFICGIATKGDPQYQTMNKWVNDSTNDENRLVYIDTTLFLKYFYKGDHSLLTPKAIHLFIVSINKRNIHPQPELTVQEDQEEKKEKPQIKEKTQKKQAEIMVNEQMQL